MSKRTDDEVTSRPLRENKLNQDFQNFVFFIFIIIVIILIDNINNWLLRRSLRISPQSYSSTLVVVWSSDKAIFIEKLMIINNKLVSCPVPLPHAPETLNLTRGVVYSKDLRYLEEVLT